MLSVAAARLYSDNYAMCYVPSGFVDDFTFSHNEANGPESQTTRMFRRDRQVAAPGEKLLYTIADLCVSVYLLTVYWCTVLVPIMTDN